MKMLKGEVVELDPQEVADVITKFLKSKGLQSKITYSEDAYGLILKVSNEIGTAAIPQNKDRRVPKANEYVEERKLDKPVQVKCASCGNSFMTDVLGRTCPKCNSIQLVVIPEQQLAKRAPKSQTVTGVENITEKVEGGRLDPEYYENTVNKSKPKG